MKVRGLVLLTRKAIVTRRFGAEAWRHLYRDVATAHPCFQSLIMPDSLVPLPAYLALHDELIRRLYADQATSNIELGRESAREALRSGLCKAFPDRLDLRGFVVSLPKLWRIYFADTNSHVEAEINGDAVDVKVLDLPQWHPYLEHFVMGFNAEALEWFCANPIGYVRVRGVGKSYHYLLQASQPRDAHEPASSDPHTRGLARRIRAVAQHLSDREIEVLILVAEGKTNDEIGVVLGISAKTAQHHVARIYRKINVSSRVESALWLVERGLIAGRLPR